MARKLPPQHESFDRAWRDLSTKWNLIPEGVRTIGATTTGPAGEPLRVAPKVMLHSCLVSRIGKRCITIFDEKEDRRREGDYVPTNVQADTLPVFG